MCALCSTDPFCFDPTRPEGEQVYDRPCDRPEHEAIDADRVKGIGSREDGFFCIPPSTEKSVGGLDGLECPADDGARAEFQNLDPCVDLPPCARPEECDDPSEERLCSEVSTSALRGVCVANPPVGEDVDEAQRLTQGAALAVETLADTCAYYGVTPPQSGPARYCFLSCVTPQSCTLGDPTITDSCESCNESYARKSDPL